MKLTNRQIDHITGRITEACDAACLKDVNALGKEVKKPDLTEAQMREQIETGVAKLKKNITCYTYWQGAFIFKEDEKAMASFKDYERKVKAIKAKWQTKQRDLIDQLLLSGNANDALALLKNVDAGKF